MSDIGEKIIALRKEKQLSQSQLAGLSKITQASLSYIESGTKNPSVETLSMICNALQISMSDFLNGTKTNNPNLSPELEQLLTVAQKLPTEKINILLTVAEAMN